MSDYNTDKRKHELAVECSTANAMKEIMRACNYMGSDASIQKGMRETLLNSHRTLQASFIRNLNEVLTQYGATTHTDARNEAAVKWAAQATGATVDLHIPFI